MKYSTKRGDGGMTGILSENKRVRKDDDRIEFLGAVDELQSFMGLLDHKYTIWIQSQLHGIMAGTPGDLEELESLFYELEQPEIKKFILPKGMANVCRTVCRRAERRAVTIGHPCIPFLNRLSDYLYALNFNED